MLGGFVASSAIAWAVTTVSAYAETDGEVPGQLRDTVEQTVESVRDAGERAVEDVRDRVDDLARRAEEPPAQEEPPPVELPEPQEPEHAEVEPEPVEPKPVEKLADEFAEKVDTVRAGVEEAVRRAKDALGSVIVIEPDRPRIPEHCSPWTWRWCFWGSPIDLPSDLPGLVPSDPTTPDVPDVSDAAPGALEPAALTPPQSVVATGQPAVRTAELLVRSGLGSRGLPTATTQVAAVDAAGGRASSPESGSGAAPSGHADTTPLAVTPGMPMASAGDAAAATTGPIRAAGRPGAQPGVTPD